MRNILTILTRDLAAYFTSPIGYIFMIVFVTISVGLYITTFFTFPVADMQPYFINLPLFLCIFIPAVTMRIWAEERKENTWEMLLTFPMKAWELVLGKFLACLIFFCATLFATVTVPFMLISLGNPDMGAILSGYFGTVLLGAFFLSVGIFFSGFYKDQIVAFVVTLLACFGIFLLGTGFIAAYIDGMLPGWGTLLGELVGLSDHYAAFTRGVIEIADILYFLAWTAVFLFLNIIYIDGRNRPRARVYFTATVVMCVVIGLLGNWLIRDASFGRFDVTEGKIHTVSDATKRILSQLDTPVQVKYYVSPRDQMPTGMNRLEQDIRARLDEMRIASRGNVQFSVVHLEVANVVRSQPTGLGEEEEEPGSEEEILEKRMADKGVEPFTVQAMGEDQITNKVIYSSIGVAYRDKPEEIIPQILPQFLPELEYRLVNTIYKLTRDEAPKVALIAPKEALNIPPEVRRMYEQMGQKIPETEDPYEYLELLLQSEKYDVQRVDLGPNNPLPEDIETLVVVNPRNFSDRHMWEINRALHSGKSVVLAVQQYEWDYQSTRQGITLNKRSQFPGVNPVLDDYGLGVDEDILMDSNYIPLRVSSGSNPLSNLLGLGQQVNLPTHILVTPETMDSDTSITSRLGPVFYLWGTAVKIDEKKLSEVGLEYKVLMRTTDRAWTVSSTAPITNASFEPPSGGLAQYPLAVLVSGQFPDAFKGQQRPPWPPQPAQPGEPPQPVVEEDEPAPVTPAPAKLLLIGAAEMFRNNFIAQQSSGNMDLFLNSVDAVTLGEDLVNVRGKKPIDRALPMPSTGTRRWWKIVNYAFANAIIAGIGIAVATVRRRSRNIYTLAHAAE